MLEITSIKEGLVIDHIEAGMGIKIFDYLELDKVSNSVALIINAKSNRVGRKDIIKIENCFKVDYTVLGLLSPQITINEVNDGVITRKITPELPERVENILECKNKNCITSTEEYVPHSFEIVNREKGTYRCVYCDHITKLSEI